MAKAALADRPRISLLPNPNVVFVVDDDPGMLMSVKRLLRTNGYDTVLFSSAKAFKNQVDFEDACCVVLDINLEDGSGIELRYGLGWEFCAGHLHDGERQPCRSQGRARVRVSRLSHKAVLGEVFDRAS
jgi:hypothetical protein